MTQQEPNSEPRLAQQGEALLRQGLLKEAAAIYDALIQKEQPSASTYSNRATIYAMQGELKDAILLLKTAIQLDPTHSGALHNLARCQYGLGHFADCVATCQHLLTIPSNNGSAATAILLQLGNALDSLGRTDEAIAAYRQAIIFNPGYAEAHYNLGNTLKTQGQLQGAVRAYQQAVFVNPEHVMAHNNMGNTLQMLGEYKQASQAFEAAISIEPTYAEAHYNLGNCHKESGQIQTAIHCFNQALQHRNPYAEVIFNRSLCLLLTGDYEQGLAGYEWRFSTKAAAQTHARPAIPRLRPDGCDEATQIVVVSEQGLGDTLQFMRYVKILRQHYRHVSFCAQTKLHGLIQTSGIDANPLTPEQGHGIAEGRWIPLLSLPWLLGVRPSDPLATAAYIHGSEQAKARWQTILAGEKRPLIAINWQGDPATEVVGLRGRSLPLDAFAPLAELPGVTLLSVQKGHGSEQLVSCAFRERFASCQAQVDATWDFLDNAAILAQCDLVISSDTAVAHLAAGMGKPTWLLLQQLPEWRWGLEGETSFWYPSMRLFRQSQAGDWAEVMERVGAALRSQLGEGWPGRGD